MHPRFLATAVAAGLGLVSSSGALAAAPATLYKSPSCGCCAAYVTHLEQNGYTVEAEHPADLGGVKRRFGVPSQLVSCHTMVLDGYTFEGHVPVDAVERTLRERPRIGGLSVPGMPAGSPGMGGTLRPPLRVYTLEGEPHGSYFRLPEWPSSS